MPFAGQGDEEFELFEHGFWFGLSLRCLSPASLAQPRLQRLKLFAGVDVDEVRGREAHPRGAQVMQQMMPTLAATVVGGMFRYATVEGFADVLRQWGDALKAASEKLDPPKPQDPWSAWQEAAGQMMGYFVPCGTMLAIERTSKIAARLAESETQ